MDYRKLCVELFGTDDEATLRKIAAEYRKKNTRNAGRKRKIADEDIHKMRAMRNAGTSMQELARTFGLSRQTVERYQLPDCFHLGWSPFEVWPSLIILSALVKSMTCINDLLPRKITKS